MISGAGIENLQQGWALAAFHGERGHFWTDVTDLVPESLPRLGKGGRVRYYQKTCNPTTFVRADSRVPLFRLGSFPPCKRCLRAAPFPPTASDRSTVMTEQEIRNL
jgi:hypothetical protein